MSKKKYYAVKEGMVRGIFETWDECKQSISGYPRAIYKSFPSREQAEEFLNSNKIGYSNYQ